MTDEPISSLLIANRGEIARRIIRTASEMGLQTVAVYSEPDATAPHVREADIAVALGGATPAESYLDAGLLISAAQHAGADAIHPGYGFLSEDPNFAQVCADAGITFVGPTPHAIRAMALKIEAKHRMAAVGVPLLPSAEVGSDVEPGDRMLAERASELGYPLLVKASAGGGGKGMQIVSKADELAEAVASARRVAASAFGDSTVFLERYLVAPRHIEIQVVADNYGAVLHLYERECSIQRRHQKIVEEAPSPEVSQDLRRRMTDAAVAAARAIDYTGVGTVEFLVDGDGFYFLEMNTRLQVEHPVTEAITGLDLVRLQLEVAMGLPLKLQQGDVPLEGHAIEARLYAEIPSENFLPTFGKLHYFGTEEMPGLRYDSGVVTGSDISSYYDPMLAKVIAHAPTRREAAQRLGRALSRMQLHGPDTNRNTLAAICRHPAFLAGETTTDFLDRHVEVLDAGPSAEVHHRHAVALAVVLQHRRRLNASALTFAPSGWRNVPSGRRLFALSLDGEPLTIEYLIDDRNEQATVSIEDRAEQSVRLLSVEAEYVAFELDGLRHHCGVRSYGSTHFVNGSGGQSEFVELDRFPSQAGDITSAGPTAPVPGVVVAVHTSAGEPVVAGQTLVVLEAMKMEHHVGASDDGVVAEVLVEVGDTVDAHQLLVVLERADES